MAGSGLPIPKNDNRLTEITPIVSGSTGSGAVAWQSIAQSGEKIASESAHYLDREEHAAKVAKIADFEVDWRSKKVAARDQFANDPEGFKNWAESSTAGVVDQVPAWLLPHAKQFLSREFEPVYGQILSEDRNRKKVLDAQTITARTKMADDDVMSVAANGKLGTPEGDEAVKTYKGILDSAVSTGLMAPDHAQLMTENLTTRAHGTVIRNDVEKVYREKGFEAARDHLSKTLDEFGGAYRIKDQIRQQTLGWLRSEEAGMRGERDAISKEWADTKKNIAVLDPAVLQDLQQRAYERGAYKVGDDIQAHTSALNMVRQVRQLPQADQMRVLAGGGFESRLSQRENASGNPATVNQLGYVGNYQFGAPRLATLGVYTPGAGENLGAWSKTPANAPGKWSGTFNIPGFPDVKTIADFKASPEAQKAAYRIHNDRMDQEIDQGGLRQYIGQTVGGVEITRDGLKGMIHLAGAGGARDFLTSGGRVNPADANGTTALDYARLGASGDLTGSRQGQIALGMIRKDMTQDLTKKISDVSAHIAKAEFPSMDEVGALVAQVGYLGTEEQKRQVAEMGAQAEYGKKFSTLPQAQREEIMTRWREKVKNGGSSYERKLNDVVVATNQKVSEAWQKDPYDAAPRFMEGIPALPAIDWASPNVGQVLAAKVSQQNTIRADQNLPAFSVLRSGEAQQLAQVMTTGDPRAGSAIIQTLASSLPPEMYRATIADPAIKAALDGMVRSYDPDRITTAMSVLDRSFRDAPQGFHRVFGDDTFKRLQTWQAHKDSLTPVAMAEMFKRADDPKFASARKKLEEEADKKLGTLKASDVAYELGTGWPGIGRLTGNTPAPPVDPIAGAAMTEEYERLVKERYVDTGNIDKAKEQAVERMTKVWGPSAVAGGALMRHPPERSYPQVDGSHDWMKADLDGTVAEIRGSPAIVRRQTPGVQPGYIDAPTFTVKLISDPSTEADIAAKRPPSYALQITDLTTGRADIPMGANGLPRRFSFDPSTARAAAEAKFGTQRYDPSQPFASTPGSPGYDVGF